MPLFDKPKFRTEAKGTLTANGSEQTLLELTREVRAFSGYIDLSNMASGDTIYVKTYVKIKSGGSYIKQGMRTFTNGQDPDLLHILDYPTTPYGFKLTIQQTKGTNRNYDYLLFSEEI